MWRDKQTIGRVWLEHMSLVRASIEVRFLRYIAGAWSLCISVSLQESMMAGQESIENDGKMCYRIWF